MPTIYFLIQGLDSAESLIESLTFQSTVSSTGEAGIHTPSPSRAPPPVPEDMATAAASTRQEVSSREENIFADWQWLPAMPLIAHEGGVGVGVIPLY